MINILSLLKRKPALDKPKVSLMYITLKRDDVTPELTQETAKLGYPLTKGGHEWVMGYITRICESNTHLVDKVYDKLYQRLEKIDDFNVNFNPSHELTGNKYDIDKFIAHWCKLAYKLVLKETMNVVSLHTKDSDDDTNYSSTIDANMLRASDCVEDCIDEMEHEIDLLLSKVRLASQALGDNLLLIVNCQLESHRLGDNVSDVFFKHGISKTKSTSLSKIIGKARNKKSFIFNTIYKLVTLSKYSKDPDNCVFNEEIVHMSTTPSLCNLFKDEAITSYDAHMYYCETKDTYNYSLERAIARDRRLKDIILYLSNDDVERLLTTPIQALNRVIDDIARVNQVLKPKEVYSFEAKRQENKKARIYIENVRRDSTVKNEQKMLKDALSDLDKQDEQFKEQQKIYNKTTSERAYEHKILMRRLTREAKCVAQLHELVRKSQLIKEKTVSPSELESNPNALYERYNAMMAKTMTIKHHYEHLVSQSNAENIENWEYYKIGDVLAKQASADEFQYYSKYGYMSSSKDIECYEYFNNNKHIALTMQEREKLMQYKISIMEAYENAGSTN